MLHKIIDINIDYEKYGVKHTGDNATITTYIKDAYPELQNSFNRPLVIICPGGGYGHLSQREGEPIALKMLELGYNAVVLRYSLVPNQFPCALMEAAYTIDYVRKHAKEWDTDPQKIIVAGFSAGGHLAASLGLLYNSEYIKEFVKTGLNVALDEIKPDGLLLGYPVISSGEYAHRGSFEKLLGTAYDELLQSLSLENRVTADAPKTFMWHTFTDDSVKLENSLLFANALRKAGVEFEYHVFPKGNHGLGLGTKETDTKDGTHYQPEVSVWTGLFKTWVENNIV